MSRLSRWRGQTSIFLVPQLGNSCLWVDCMFEGQRGHWCVHSDASGVWTEQLDGSRPPGTTGLMWCGNVLTAISLFICLSLLLNTSESLDRVHLMVCSYIFRLSRSRLYTKVVRSRSRSQEQKSASVSCLRVVCLRLNVVLFLSIGGVFFMPSVSY